MPRTKRHNIDRRADRVLADMATIADDTLLTTPEVARWFDVSTYWLEIGRHKGWGPPFKKLGKRLVRLKQKKELASFTLWHLCSPPKASDPPTWGYDPRLSPSGQGSRPGANWF
jgi:hypothetical protein